MSDTEAVPDTTAEETPKGEEEPLNDVSKVEWRGGRPQAWAWAGWGSRKKCEGLTFVCCPLIHILQEGKLYIGNLAFKTTEEGLREAFGEHGEITFARVISDRDSGRSRYVFS